MYESMIEIRKPGCTSSRARPAGRNGSARAAWDAASRVPGRTYLRLWRPIARKRLDVICAEVHARELRMHVHSEVQISLPLEPFRLVDGLGRAERTAPGSIGIVNATELHGALPVGQVSWNTRVLLVGEATMSAVWKQLGGQPEGGADGPWFPHRVVHDPALATELHALFERLQSPPTDVDCEDTLVECLAQLIGRHAIPAPPAGSRRGHRWGVSRVRDYIREHVAEHVSIDQLARVALLSKYYLLRAFAREYGLSPHAYQMELRLAAARTLLARGTPPSRAAFAAGFADQSHLTRRMKAAFGFTPAAYARQFAGRGREPVPADTAPSATMAEIETAA